MLWQFFSLPGIENGIEYRYFSRYRIEVRNSSIVTTLQLSGSIFFLHIGEPISAAEKTERKAWAVKSIC